MWATGAAVGLALIGLAAFMQWREANDTEIAAVALNPDDPAQASVGALIYRGGLDIPRMGQNIGGLSALRWDPQTGRLLALTDDARWVRLRVVENGDELVGLDGVLSGPLVGLEGGSLSGKAQGDSESLTRSAEGGWLIGFERDHRIWRYPDLDQRPLPSGVDPQEWLGTLGNNSGVEALAGDESALFVCAERLVLVAPGEGNCTRGPVGGEVEAVAVFPQGGLLELGGMPTDADMASDGTAFVLLRSYTPRDGNGAEIVALSAQGALAGLATLRPPLSVDNFEGLAVREEEGRTFLYIVSDDNFSSSQRTLLMKFEVAPDAS